MSSSDQVEWNNVDADDDAPPAPPDEFPRLTIQHLMAWTAATAVAFLPYQIERESFTQSSDAVSRLMQSVMVAVVMVGYGVMNGVYLFVSAATIYWKRRGIAATLEPGHWLAIEGALSWVLSMATWIVVALAADAIPRAMMWMSAPQMALALILLVWFLRLALKSPDSAAWRWMYVVVAVTPFANLIVTVLFARYFGIATMLGQGVLIAIGAALLAVAMLGDWRRKIQRHWSHWIAAGAVLVGGLMQLVYYVWFWFNQPF